MFFIIPNHKDGTIARMVDLYMRDWQIDSIFIVTTDHACTNDTTISSLQQKLTRTDNAFILGGKFIHLRCATHILNLIGNDRWKEKNNAINVVRSYVKYVKSSPSRLVKFKVIAIEEEIDCKSLLQFHVPTRWNLIYLILPTALKFWKVFDPLCDDLGITLSKPMVMDAIGRMHLLVKRIGTPYLC